MYEIDQNSQEIKGVICNQCGKKLRVENGIVKEGCFHGEQRFGYFSHMDGEKHSFDLCEECYQKLITGFHIPIKKEIMLELL